MVIISLLVLLDTSYHGNGRMSNWHIVQIFGGIFGEGWGSRRHEVQKRANRPIPDQLALYLFGRNLLNDIGATRSKAHSSSSWSNAHALRWEKF